MSRLHSSKKRKNRSAPTPLGVLEFTSALNGDDPLQILQKLHQFVRVTQYERSLVTDHFDGDDDRLMDNEKSDNTNDDDDDDDVSYISFDDEEEDEDLQSSNKRQKLLQSSTSSKKHVKHSWKLDKNNYNVPFIGTSVTKGETGSINLTQWPTGFMEVYRRYSPLGVELNQNDFVGALPPAGVHKVLCGHDDEVDGDGMEDGNGGTSSGGSGKRQRKKKTGGQQQHPPQSRGKIISITLQTKYWTAVNEWILSFVPLDKLKQDSHWQTTNYHSSSSTTDKSKKCALPPQIMTILIKERMVGWINAIHKYIAKQQSYTQIQLQQRKEQRQRQKQLQQKQLKLSKEERLLEQKRLEEIQKKNERLQRRWRREQFREEALVVSALQCLTSLCYLSNGTAREVLRRLASGGIGGGKDASSSTAFSQKFGKGVGQTGGNADGGTEWMVQLFQQVNKSSSSSSSLSSVKPLVECVRLVCTLLETQDYIVLSRLTEAHSPGWATTKRGGGKKGVGNFGMGHIALRHGIQRLLDIVRQSQVENGDDQDGDDKVNVESDLYAECIARLLRGVNGIILPSSQSGRSQSGNGGKKDNNGGFVLGMGATADLLSGEVLGGLAELSLFAPQFESSFGSIQDIINGEDDYDDLDRVEMAAVEARRLLFVLLADTRRSPFLRDSSSSIPVEKEDQFAAYLPQLSKALHSLLSGQGHSVSLKMMLGLCLRRTPEITPHFFRSLQLSDPKPNYRSLAALTFVEGVVRDIPFPNVRALRDGKMPTTEQILSEVIPACVTKSLLSKVLQSSCALLTSGGLKLIITLLRRTCGISYDDDYSAKNGVSSSSSVRVELQNSLRKAVMSHMPEFPILLSIPSRFDSFETSSHCSHNTIVLMQLCEAFECYARIEPSLVVTAKYDWAKFLPLEDSSERSFLNVEPLLQYRILRTLLQLSKLDHMSFSSKMLPNSLSIMTSKSVTTPEVYVAARELALSFLVKEISPYSEGNIEDMSCHHYEASLWVDVISEDTIEDLMTMITEARQQSVQHKMSIFQALTEAGLEYDSASSVSPLLSLSISCLMADDEDSRAPFTSDFGLSLIKVAIKTLLYLTNPKHFAASIVYAAREHTPSDKNAASLYQVATAIMDDGINANIRLYDLTSNIFHRECLLNCMLRVSNGNANDLPHCNFTTESLRQCLSILKYTKEGDCRDKLLNHLRKIVVHICAVDVSAVTDIETILAESTLDVFDVEGIMLVIFSLLKSIGVRRVDTDFQPSLIKDGDNAMNGLAGIKVVTSLLRHNVVPAYQYSSATDDIWKECCTVVASDNVQHLRLKHFLLSVVLQMFPDEKLSVISPLLATTMFQLWAALSSDLEDKVSAEVSIRLLDYLAEIFSSPKKGHLAWFVYKSVSKMGMTSFVDSCLHTLLLKEELGRESKHCFLASIISYDNTNFNFACLAEVLLENYDNHTRLWGAGVLDMAAYTLVTKTIDSQWGADKAAKSINLSKVASMTSDRFLTLLRGMNENGAQVLSLEMIVDIIEKLCSHGYNIPETVQCLHDVFDSLEKGTVLSVQQQMQLVRLVICVSASKQEREESKLVTKAFLLCCKLISKLLKKVIRTKGTEEQLVVSLDVLIGYTANLWEYKDHFNVEIISSSIIDNLIVSCLKYGMTDARDFTSSSVLGGCLKIVRLIVAQTSGGEFFKVRTLSPGQIHAMAISHSAFNVAITSREKEESSTRLISRTISSTDSDSRFCRGLSQRQELIRLMLCCVSLDCNHVKIDSGAWASVLSAYNASTGVTDGLLRRLLYLYDLNNCCESEIFLCDYQWGEMGKKHSQRLSNDENIPPYNEQSWEWFVDSISLDRIRSTLTQFPITDYLVPLADSDVESDSMSANVVNNRMDTGTDDSVEDTSDEDDGSLGTSSSVESSDEPKEVIPPSKIYSTADPWRGTGEDPRYSPGFILPLVLGALEANYPEPKDASDEGSKDAEDMKVDEDDDEDESEEYLARKQVFSMTARKLCDRGCIALAVASLSSRCPSVRKVAVAICGLFLRALQMKESHEMKSWRERPQQEMIMASLQRGLAVRRAMQVKKFEEANDGVELGSAIIPKQRFNVTMLPALSAIFLAKALLIVSRPSDDIFGAVNKYFLRLNDYRGAFQDCFGLPAFLSLYCSSSDDLVRCRTERSWALMTLKDSAVDEFCYRIIAQHHVPELIMSSFDSLCGQQGGKSELSLTIDVIQCLMKSGGPRSTTHLIQRLGLLSWLHGVISWRSISFVLPYAALKCKFLQLISTAVESCCNENSTSDNSDDGVFLEKIPLADAVIRICLDESDTSSNESRTVLAATCDTLWAIHVADKKQGSGTHRVGLTNLTQMTGLLTKCVDNSEMFAQALICTCALPYSNSDEDQAGRPHQLFCELALSFLLEERVRLCEGDTIIILKRVSDLMSKFANLRGDTTLVTKILQCRRIAASIRGGVQVWERFIPFLGDSKVEHE